MTIGIGIIGGGTVGTGVIETLVTHAEDLANKAGVQLRLAHVCTRTPSRLDGVDLAGAPLTTDIDAVINDPQVHVVCELIGGEEIARTLTLKAFQHGKHVITANKMLLALHGPELTAAAIENNVELRYEAAVAGGIPIIKSIREGLAGNRIEYVYGILNGTCNYILSRMTYDQQEFGTVLEKAIEKGFAETPPDLDINGDDTAHKCQILASLCFGTKVSLDDIYIEGITRITHEDVANAEELGYIIKLIAVIRDLGETIDVRVHPVLISEDHLLANVRNEFNGVYVKSDICDRTMYYGRGAGRYPTASAVVADIVDIARGHAGPAIPPFLYINERPVQPISEISSRYYIRFMTDDTPGVLGGIASTLGENGVGIASVMQKEQHGEAGVPIVIMTYETKESALQNALATIRESGVIRDETHVIRVL